MLIQLVKTSNFINRVTSGKLSEKQVSRVCAYLRAKKLCFYDDFSRDHSSILKELEVNKMEVINALKNSL